MEPDRLQKRFRSKRSPQAYYKSSRALDRTIYPEILVIVDYDGYRLHGGDNVQVKRYFVSFWNGVDLRYRLLKGPKIRISIAGIIISRVSAMYEVHSERLRLISSTTTGGQKTDHSGREINRFGLVGVSIDLPGR